MQHYPLDLSRYLNNDGISFETDVEDGDFDGLGNTYPAEKLPASKQLTNLCGTPLLFPDKRDGTFNNVVLEAQQIMVPSGNYSTLAVIGAADSGRYADGGYQDRIVFLYGDAEEHATLRLKDRGTAIGRTRSTALCTALPVATRCLSEDMRPIRPFGTRRSR